MSYFNIHQPCHEKWEVMSPSEKGRFCDLCSKHVSDLTGFSHSRIAEELQSSSGELCVKISGAQLREGYVKHHLSKEGSRFARSFLLALLLSFGAALFSVKDASARSSLNSFIKEMKASLIDSTADQKIIRGIVTDKESKEPLPFANVRIYSGDSLIAEAMSDIDGKYSIKIPAGKWSLLSVRASYIGYTMNIREVKLAEKGEELDVPLQVGGAIMGAMVIIVEGENEGFDTHKLDGMKRTFSREELRRIPH
jgi:hypothetical protein